MSGPVVTVVDYGRGNLLSVARALEHVGATPVLTDAAERLADAERLILPGVGAFGDAMETLTALGLVEPLRAFAGAGRPFLGICLGMQLLLEESGEHGRHAGLGLIAGRVEALAPDAGGRARVPSIGWQPLLPERDWADTPLAGTPAGAHAYFVHSFQARPTDPTDLWASYRFGEAAPVAAVIGRDNVVGCQFHPEKSGAVGLAILKRWLQA